MAKIQYTNVQCVFKYADDHKVLIAVEGEEIWVPITCVSWKSANELDELTRNDDFEIQIATWKAKQLGVD